MTPYYAANGIELYLGDALELVDSWPRSAFLLTDPPYGVGYQPTRSVRTYRAPCYSRGRRTKSAKLYAAREYPAIVGDDQPFDPTPFLGFRRVVLFGANNFAAALPPSNGWIVWDKVDGLRSVRSERGGEGFNNQGDAELAWSNVTGAVRLVRHRWMGLLRGSERQEPAVHPTQKPVELMARIIRRFAKPDDLIIDPFAGSGSTLIAAYREGHRAIGVEIVEAYCEAAAARLEAHAAAGRRV